MTVRQEVDVLVVGLGPAGGVAAATAAAAGLRVMAVERKAEVGVPVQCAEFIPLPLGGLANNERVRQQEISGMVSRLPSGVAEYSEAAGYMIDRAAFDQALAQQAAEQGAVLCRETRLLRVAADKHSAWISGAAGEHEIGYRVLIAADGPHSSVAASLNLPALECVFTRQYRVRLLQPLSDTEVWLSKDFPGGYAWLFPKEDFANLGAGADKRFTQDLKQPLDALHYELVQQGIVEAEILGMTGGLIPVGGLRPSFVLEDIVFVGDAAGLTHPITGAGIAAAVDSGALAGEAAVRYLQQRHSDALQEYAHEIVERYGLSLQRALLRRRELDAYWGKEISDAPFRQGWVAFPEYFDDKFLLLGG